MLKFVKSLLLSVGLVAASLVFVPAAASAEQGDCDANAVIRCGAYSLTKLQEQYRANQAGNVQSLYRTFGISSVDDLKGMVEGTVSRDGKVYVGDKVVATNGVTAGRQRIGGDNTAVLGGAFYQRPLGQGFAEGVTRLQAYVKMENGKFVYAVIKACGNPVKGTPTVTPPPAPQPKPSFTIMKDVRADAKDTWVQSVKVQPGDVVEFRIIVRNTGDVDLPGVTLRDNLPNGLYYVSGSQTKDSKKWEDNLRIGSNVGPIAKGKYVTVTFKTKVTATGNTACTNALVNTAYAKTPTLPEKSDTADVRACVPVKPPTPTTPTTPVPPTTPEEPTPEEPTPVEEEKPAELPNTGPVAYTAIFGATTAFGAALYRLQLFYRRLLSK